MRKDAGIDGDAQRLGQLGWMLFLKIYSDLEVEAELEDQRYVSPIPQGLRWDEWADSRRLGKNALTGEGLLGFIEGRLFPSLRNLDLSVLTGTCRQRGALVRSVFEDAINYMKSGTLLRQVIDRLNEDIDFNESRTRHLFGEIYETLLKDLQSAGNAGEFYTPRPVTQFAVDMVAPQLGETVLDPACGTGGFLTHALLHVRQEVKTPLDLERVKSSIGGVEKKALPHLLCVTNMMVHGIEVPVSIRHDNTLARPLRDYGAEDQVDIVLTNPPFVGIEPDGIESNFPSQFRTRETAHLFLALTLELLKPTGRAAIVLPDSFLFAEGVAQELRRTLLQQCNLHTIIRLPTGVFSPYTDIRTNVLFFDRSGPTADTWFYEVRSPHAGGRFTKTQPIADSDLDPVRKWWTQREVSSTAWVVGREHVLGRPYLNLDIENPTRRDPGLEFTERMLKFESDRMEAAVRWDEFAAVASELRVRSDAPGRFVAALSALRDRVQLTSGFVEELRLTLTELAVRGLLDEAPQAVESGSDLVERLRLRSAASMPASFGAPFSIPTDWAWTQVGQIADFTIGKTPPTKVAHYWADGDTDEGHPFISISDMPRRGVVTATERRITSAAVLEDIRREPIPSGTLLMAFKLSVGKTAVAGVAAGYCNEAIAAIDVADDGVRQYLLWALPVLAGYGSKNPAVRGATLNKKSIQALWVPIPPSNVQGQIVSRLMTLAELLEQYASAHEQARLAAGASFKLLRAVAAH